MMLSMEGLLRALQPDVGQFVGLCALTLIVLFFWHRLIKADETGDAIDTESVASQRRTANRVAAAVCALAALNLGWKVLVFASANRIPRADADKSDVYNQMKKNAEPEIKK